MKNLIKQAKDMFKILNKGFTFIELLVVVLIIGILASIALPQYQLVKDKAKYTQAMTLLASINQAQQRYILAHGDSTTEIPKLDIELPSTGKITSNEGTNDYYTDKWGGCSLHNTGYGMCKVQVGRGYVWYFLRWNSPWYRSCWVIPPDNVRGNRLCQAITGKKDGKMNGTSYKMYYFY